MAADDDPLAPLREAIDAVDDELLALLNRRATLVEQVAEHKQAAGMAFYVPDRERSIIERLSQHNPGPFPTEAIRPVIQEIISACLSLEKGVRVAYLGPEATFTHLAVRRHFGTSARTIPSGTIAGVFEEVERGQADYGVVPVENSSEGIVSHTLDTFMESPLGITAEILVEVSHCLLARRGLAEGSIERVYSHPQALAQCRRWLAANLPRAALVEAALTADAARAAQGDAAGAAIASELAARMYDLHVVRRALQDLADNVTRFLVLGRSAPAPSRDGRDKTTVLLAVRDEPGVLYRVLEPLSAAGINLTKIESRPSRRRPWEYVFFLDLDGHRADGRIAPLLETIGRSCELLKVLGSYRKAERQ